MKFQRVHFLLMILALVLFFFSTNQVSAITVGPNSPGTNTQDSSIELVNWSHLDYVQTSDDKYATSMGNMKNGDVTVSLKATNFGFSIPSGAIINGISVNVKRKAGDESFFDNEIRIIKGGIMGATNKLSSDAWPTSDATTTYGGDSYLWDENWTYADINSAKFGFAISVKKTEDGNKKPSIDWINIIVTYTLPTASDTTARGGDGVRPTTVTFSGKAFPGAKILVVDKDVRSENIVSQDTIADEEGKFNVNFIGVLQDQHSFGLLIKDKENRTTQTKFFNIDTFANDLVVKDILMPPTTGLLQRLVSRGQPAIITGSASPNNSVVLEIDDIIKKEVNTEKDGSYKVAIDTGILEFGTHRVQVKQIDAGEKRESDYSLKNSFVVSHLTLPKTDLSGDGIVNIKDWSIFLSNWGTKDETQKKIIDLNDDGKVDISDFSIFIRTIKKRN
jgi:hypothetical protein